MQKPFDELLIRQSPLFGESLRGLNVDDGHSDRHGLSRATYHGQPLDLSFLLRLHEELRDDFRMGIPPLGLLFFRPKIGNPGLGRHTSLLDRSRAASDAWDGRWRSGSY